MSVASYSRVKVCVCFGEVSDITSSNDVFLLYPCSSLMRNKILICLNVIDISQKTTLTTKYVFNNHAMKTKAIIQFYCSLNVITFVVYSSF